EIQYHLSWRNVKTVALALYRIDLIQDLHLNNRLFETNGWLETINLSASRKLQSWTKETDDKGDYRPGQQIIRFGSKLPVGAYLIEAKSGSTSSRDLLLVTDTALVLKASGKQALAYFCNALTGAPISKAKVKLWEHYNKGPNWAWRESVRETNQDG